MAKTVKITYPIFGEAWDFFLASDRQYKTKFGSDSGAICLLKEREVWFNEKHFDNSVIAHEVVHILFAQSPHSSSNLNAHQTEEVAAELISKSWYLWALWVGEIEAKLRRSRI